jgi:hypothetical protein
MRRTLPKQLNPRPPRPIPEPTGERVLPELTSLQFLVLTPLTSRDEISGRELRAWLADKGLKSSGPQFYQMMARLEDSDFVEGWYAQKAIEHQVVNERRYKITANGLSAWENTRDFYSTSAAGSTVRNREPGQQRKTKRKVMATSS